MHFETAKLQAMPLQLAINKVLSNTSNSYDWYPVRNKKKILIEIGGAKGVIKAYIPSFDEKGKYVTYQNGYFKHEYSVSNNGSIEFPTFTDIHNLKDKQFINFLDNTDFKKYYPKVQEIDIIEHSIAYSVKL